MKVWMRYSEHLAKVLVPSVATNCKYTHTHTAPSRWMLPHIPIYFPVYHLCNLCTLSNSSQKKLPKTTHSNHRYDEDDAAFTSDDDFPDVGEAPEESKEELPSAAPKVPPKPKAATPKPAVAKQKAPKARSTSPKAKAKGLPKPQVKPKVEPKLGEGWGRFYEIFCCFNCVSVECVDMRLRLGAKMDSIGGLI